MNKYLLTEETPFYCLFFTSNSFNLIFDKIIFSGMKAKPSYRKFLNATFCILISCYSILWNLCKKNSGW